MRTQRSLDKRLRRFIHVINRRDVVAMTATQKVVYDALKFKHGIKYHRCDHGGSVLSNELQLGSAGWGSCV